jgi:hypothetical protein
MNELSAVITTKSPKDFKLFLDNAKLKSTK